MAARVRVRQQLFAELQPVGVPNCDLERVGERHDGGYLICRNLLTSVHAGYSYGTAGYDRLKETFVVAHLHFNNFGCREDLAPFPSDAYEVLLFNRRVAGAVSSGAAARPSHLDAPNDPQRPDCQHVR